MVPLYKLHTIEKVIDFVDKKTKKTLEPLKRDQYYMPRFQRNSESVASHSSSGLGHRPFTAVTGVRTPYGTPFSL